MLLSYIDVSFSPFLKLSSSDKNKQKTSLGLLTGPNSQWALPARALLVVGTFTAWWFLCYVGFCQILPWFPNQKRALNIWPYVDGRPRVQETIPGGI